MDHARVFHWGYVVPNMERALKMWQRDGATLIVPPAIDPIQNVSCAFLLYGNALPIELVAPLADGPNPVESRLKKGGGLDHVCLFSDDLEKEVETMQADGAHVLVEPCYGAVFDRRLAFLATRAGLTVELMTRVPVGRASEDPLAKYMAAASR